MAEILPGAPASVPRVVHNPAAVRASEGTQRGWRLSDTGARHRHRQRGGMRPGTVEGRRTSVPGGHPLVEPRQHVRPDVGLRDLVEDLVPRIGVDERRDVGEA